MHQAERNMATKHNSQVSSPNDQPQDAIQLSSGSKSASSNHQSTKLHKSAFSKVEHHYPPVTDSEKRKGSLISPNNKHMVTTPSQSELAKAFVKRNPNDVLDSKLPY